LKSTTYNFASCQCVRFEPFEIRYLPNAPADFPSYHSCCLSQSQHSPVTCSRRGARKLLYSLAYVYRRILVGPVEEDIHVEGGTLSSYFTELFCARHQTATQVQRIQLCGLSRAEPMQPLKRVKRAIELPGGQLVRRARPDEVEQDVPTISGRDGAAVVAARWLFPC
jgi:hypothetical protein